MKPPHCGGFAFMAAFEAENGPIETLPIFVGERPKQVFSINPPGKVKAEKPSRALRRLDHARAIKNTARERKNQERVATVRRMSASGETIQAMADAVGITPTSIMRVMRDNNIPRGLKMNLEG